MGYLLLDAVVVNSDRHHENWGVLQLPNGRRELAPSYDHASSLGRELTDDKRLRRLTTRDPAFTVEVYVSRARSGLYAAADAVRPLHPAKAFELAGERRPEAMVVWLEKLRRMDMDVLERVVARIPNDAIRDPERAFALAVLRSARHHLLGAPFPSLSRRA